MSGWQERATVGERRAGALLARLIDVRGPVTVADLVSAIREYPEDPDDALAELERDVELLRRRGLKIDRCGTGEDAYRIAAECWQLRPLVLDVIDSALLERALSLSTSRDDALAGAVDALHSNAAPAIADTTVSLSPRGSAARGRPEAYSRLHRLDGLMARRVTVGFGYPNVHGDVVSHRLHVGGLGEARGVWYAVGTEPGSSVVRSFAVSEMHGPVRELDAGGTYEIPGDFDLSEHLALGWRMGPDPFRARVRFDASLATWATSVLSHLMLDDAADGSVDAVVTVGDMDGFVSWVQSFGTHARIIHPAAAAARAREVLEQVVSRHA